MFTLGNILFCKSTAIVIASAHLHVLYVTRSVKNCFVSIQMDANHKQGCLVAMLQKKGKETHYPWLKKC